ncbi:MAG TPA: GNAT family N-acetyltransferase [Syntrophomonadaceae bacterium]|nr:GNAT family N-acetyltransferase [Syntrophomonadaceae bacterium]
MVELIRTPEPKLIQRLVELESLAFKTGGWNEWTFVPIIRHGLVFCFRLKGEVIGVAEYMRDWEQPSLAYLFGISIEEDHRGQNLGTILLRDSMEELKRQGISNVELTVSPENHPAIAVYRKLGFEIIEYRKNEYGDGEDRLAMSLAL